MKHFYDKVIYKNQFQTLYDSNGLTIGNEIFLFIITVELRWFGFREELRIIWSKKYFMLSSSLSFKNVNTNSIYRFIFKKVLFLYELILDNIQICFIENWKRRLQYSSTLRVIFLFFFLFRKIFSIKWINIQIIKVFELTRIDRIYKIIK